uniref:Uncharacterized protein n=1 Tax=Picea glauca TaxID=3330 RepID=A0A117NIF1_PICGL|nr:hypothetical protein ABT39_MTgene3065 [Picea glauca]QHR87279.1 hypothetical protein Q903MT_gene1289 [Picea sitchensis]
MNGGCDRIKQQQKQVSPEQQLSRFCVQSIRAGLIFPPKMKMISFGRCSERSGLSSTRPFCCYYRFYSLDLVNEVEPYCCLIRCRDRRLLLFDQQ